ncbi:hypothetical protein DFH09DRAFT_1073718 [Mycena vulgaris]|nr:hypothetical protein DFH09DRAFT_1073718 [Mycena vulgaris]
MYRVSGKGLTQGNTCQLLPFSSFLLPPLLLTPARQDASKSAPKCRPISNHDQNTPADREYLGTLPARQLMEFRNLARRGGLFTLAYIADNAATFLDHEWVDIVTLKQYLQCTGQNPGSDASTTRLSSFSDPIRVTIEATTPGPAVLVKPEPRVLSSLGSSVEIKMRALNEDGREMFELLSDSEPDDYNRDSELEVIEAPQHADDDSESEEPAAASGLASPSDDEAEKCHDSGLVESDPFEGGNTVTSFSAHIPGTELSTFNPIFDPALFGLPAETFNSPIPSKSGAPIPDFLDDFMHLYGFLDGISDFSAPIDLFAFTSSDPLPLLPPPSPELPPGPPPAVQQSSGPAPRAPKSRRSRQEVDEANIVHSTRSRPPTARKRYTDEDVAKKRAKGKQSMPCEVETAALGSLAETYHNFIELFNELAKN